MVVKEQGEGKVRGGRGGERMSVKEIGWKEGAEMRKSKCEEAR